MMLFKIGESNLLNQIKELPFRLEKEIQNLTEMNLKEIFDLRLVKSEFSLNNFRIDSLAFDEENKSFVIIEYKRDKNFSVIDQGYAYLSLMLNNKADFILEYNECNKNPLKKSDVDWTQSKVIFIAPLFTTYQREAINFKDLPIELWEIARYENQSVSFEQVLKSQAKESIKTITKSTDSNVSVIDEIKVYTEDDHLEKAGIEIKELYERLKGGILNLGGDYGDFEIKPKKLYIAFVLGTNVIDVHLQKKQIKMWINLKAGDLKDEKMLAKDVANIGHWGNGDYEICVSNDEYLEYILSLIKQSARKNSK
jgi:predicted transport protein